MLTDNQIKERILSKAEEMFFQFGFSKVTMDEIAAELGMSKKTLYKFFQSKEQLLRILLSDIKCEVTEYIDTLFADKEMDFVEKLRKMMNYIGKQSSKFKGPFVHDLQKTIPDCWHDINEFRTKHAHDKFEQLLDEGIAKGTFRADIDKELMVLIYVNTIHALINPDFLAQVPYSASQVFETVIKIIFEGILSEEGRVKYISQQIQETDNQ